MKILTGIFGIMFSLGGGGGLLIMLVYALGTANTPIHWPVLAVYGLVLVLLAGILLVRAAEKEL
jgi:hypothetical protein